MSKAKTATNTTGLPSLYVHDESSASSFQSVAFPEHFGQRYWLLLLLFLLSMSLKDVASCQSA